MRLFTLGRRLITIIDEIGLDNMVMEMDATGLHLHTSVKRQHTELADTYLDVSTKFEWRDMWVGVYKGKDATYICPVPMLPIILKVKTA